MSPAAITTTVALVILALAWLVVSFTNPSRRRTRIEWVGAVALYAVLITIFVRGLRWALAVDSTAGLIGFAFLCLFFGGGLILSVVQAVRDPGAGGESDGSPTH